MKKFAFAMISGLVLLSCGTNAAETGLVREFYACNFKEGKGMADLEGARDVLLEQVGKIRCRSWPAAGHNSLMAGAIRKPVERLARNGLTRNTGGRRLRQQIQHACILATGLRPELQDRFGTLYQDLRHRMQPHHHVVPLAAATLCAVCRTARRTWSLGPGTCS